MNSSNSSQDEDINTTSIALTITKKQNQKCIGAAVHRRQPRSSMEDEIQYSLELFDFFDNEQFSAVSLTFQTLFYLTLQQIFMIFMPVFCLDRHFFAADG
jgi:hypothetical protein